MRKPASDKATSPLLDAIASFSPELPLAVAFSGGADSTALLVACSRKWPGQVAAIHVHHGLQPGADDFVRHCEAVCAALRVPLAVRRVDGRHARGQSPEDAARIARYAAIGTALQQRPGGLACPSVAIAQHADDQVETMLLALSRGAGLPGLAAMPARWDRDGITFHRPLLAVHAADIRSWLAYCNVTFIEDPTNTDQGLTRNRIRARLLPSLHDAFPQFRETFARSARHAAQSQLVLEEVARIDASACGEPGGDLRIGSLQTLSRPRQANLLRYWLRSLHRVTPSAAQIDELMDQIAACTTRGHRIEMKVAHGFAKRRGDRLSWYNAQPDPTPTG